MGSWAHSEIVIFSAPLLHRSWQIPELPFLLLPRTLPVSGYQRCPYSCAGGALPFSLPPSRLPPATCCSRNCHSPGIAIRPTQGSCQPQVQVTLQQPVTPQTRAPLLPHPCPPAPGPLSSLKQLWPDLGPGRKGPPSRGNLAWLQLNSVTAQAADKRESIIGLELS